MKRTIKHGILCHKQNSIKIFECPCCHCRFETDEDDYIKPNIHCHTHCSKCPECGAESFLHGTVNTSTRKSSSIPEIILSDQIIESLDRKDMLYNSLDRARYHINGKAVIDYVCDRAKLNVPCVLRVVDKYGVFHGYHVPSKFKTKR